MEGNELEYVGFRARLGAAIVDNILLLVIAVPLTLYFYGPAYFRSGYRIWGPMDIVLNWVFPIIAPILFWVWKQATPGKMLIGARIVDAKTGEAPSVGQCVGRYVAYILSLVVLGFGFFWIIFDSRKQGWHDKLAGTVVIRPKKRVRDVQFEHPLS